MEQSTKLSSSFCHQLERVARRASVPFLLCSLLPLVTLTILVGPLETGSGTPYILLAALLSLVLTAVITWGQIRRSEKASAELITARDQALKAMETERNFLSNVSHKIRAPLTSIRAFAEILREYGDENPQNRREFLEIIIGESERLSRLIDDLLNLRKIQSGKEEWDFTLISIEETLNEVYRALTLGRKDNRLQVELDIPKALTKTFADRDRIKQVWTNLLSNAIKYSDKEGQIKIHGSQENHKITVTISDQGRGISPAEQTTIFDRFYRAAPDRVDDQAKGTGLGLAIAKDIVNRHCGHIEVESELGQGATFRVILPIQNQDNHPQRESQEPEKALAGEQNRS